MSAEKFMKMALSLAREAAMQGEVPVGCVIVDGEGRIVGEGRNRREEKQSALSHAEVEAIEMACRTKNNWRLDDCSLYVSLEPCPMCAGAIINARIGKLYYGAKDPVTGSCGSVINLFMENYGHEPEIRGGILEEESRGILNDFFAKLRSREKR